MTDAPIYELHFPGALIECDPNMHEWCVISGCGKPAHAIYHWGSDNHSSQHAAFCQECGQDLFEKLKPLLTLNIVWLFMQQINASVTERPNAALR